MNAASAPRARLPLTVIGGFLGAGKTTLLNRLLRGSKGRRFAVLVNDFGALNIDAELIASSTGETVALTNGCVCCSIGDDLTAALIRVIEAPRPFDAVVIEASGVSDPWRIAQVALADPALCLDGVVVLVDSSACLGHVADPMLADSLQRQLKAADLIIVNKIDLVDAHQRQRLNTWLETVAPKTPVFEATQGRVPMALLGGRMPDADGMEDPAGQHGPHNSRHDDDDDEHEHEQTHDHGDAADHAAIFDTWSLRPTATFSAKALRDMLRAMPAGVLRLKGVLRTDAHGWAELQFAGRHGSLRRAITAPETGAAIVAIGLHGRWQPPALAAAIAAARTGTADQPRLQGDQPIA